MPTVTWDNTAPERLVNRLAFSPGGDFEDAVMVDAGTDAEYTFTAPFTGRLVLRYGGAVPVEADIGATNSVSSDDWASHIVTGYGPGIIPSGTEVTLRFVGDDTLVSAVKTYFDFEEDISIAAAADTAPGSISNAVSWSNTGASAI